MDRHSDLEELLEDSEPRTPTWSFPSRVLLVLGVVAMGGLGLLTIKGSHVQLRSKSGSFVGLQEADVDADDEEPKVDNCFQMAMYYADPVKMDGSERTIELTAELCQQRCQVTLYCEHFTYWPDGGCLLTGEGSFAKPAPVKYSDTTSGPKFCPGAIQAAQDAIAAAGGVASSGLQDAAGAATNVVDSVVQSGVQQAESSWGGVDEKKTVAAVAAGVNGTTCSAYPACVDVGIKEGDCCPNADNVILGCCNGFPKTVEEVVIKVGTECSKYPKCVALNITGGCCPTREGLMLGCCDSGI